MRLLERHKTLEHAAINTASGCSALQTLHLWAGLVIRLGTYSSYQTFVSRLDSIAHLPVGGRRLDNSCPVLS